MLDEQIINKISKIFIGDVEEWYSYKSGPKLVLFFNTYFDYHDLYGEGFPSRWQYVSNHLIEMVNNGKIDSFFNIILNKNYILKDSTISEIEAIEKAELIEKELNALLRQSEYMLIKKDDLLKLININEDLEIIGSGGFANVYKQKSTGYAVKKLQDKFIINKEDKSRFKREFEIMTKLQDQEGILKVIDFNSETWSYRMECAKSTLKQIIDLNKLSESKKIIYIQQILNIMSDVHISEIIHRDLSPTNIFLVNNTLKIGDFGLGKNLNSLASHQTIATNAYGQFDYCAPEQFMRLKDANKRSDVYSLGRIINFIMTGSPRNFSHKFRSVTEKATAEHPDDRFGDARELNVAFNKSVIYHADKDRNKQILNKISDCIFDDEIESYIYELENVEMCKKLMQVRYFDQILLDFMKIDDKHAIYAIDEIETGYTDAAKTFQAYDVFSTLANDILQSQEYSFVVKEKSAKILHYVAANVNRWNAQGLIKKLIDTGVEPAIEEILIG